MLKAAPEIEVIPLHELEDTPQKPKHPWNVYALSAFAVAAVILVNVCSPVKNSLYQLGVEIHSFGLIGPLLFLLFNGLIVIPLALPYLVFEMTIAFLIQDFVYAVCFSLAGKLIGAGVSYLLTKYLLKQKIRDSLRGLKVYKGIEHVMEKNPVKFSLILRIIIMPLFLKNYGLAVPNSVDFKLYMLCTLITSVPTTVLNIYIFKQAGDLADLFSGDQSALQKVISVGMILLSIVLVVYLVGYTRRIMRELEKISASAGAGAGDVSKPAEKDIEMVIEVKSASLEIKSTEILKGSNKNGMMELPEEPHVIGEDREEFNYDNIVAL